MACPKNRLLVILQNQNGVASRFWVGLSTAIALFVPFFYFGLGVVEAKLCNISMVFVVIFTKKAQKVPFPLLSLTHAAAGIVADANKKRLE